MVAALFFFSKEGPNPLDKVGGGFFAGFVDLWSFLLISESPRGVTIENSEETMRLEGIIPLNMVVTANEAIWFNWHVPAVSSLE